MLGAVANNVLQHLRNVQVGGGGGRGAHRSCYGAPPAERTGSADSVSSAVRACAWPEPPTPPSLPLPRAAVLPLLAAGHAGLDGGPGRTRQPPPGGRAPLHAGDHKRAHGRAAGPRGPAAAGGAAAGAGAGRRGRFRWAGGGVGVGGGVGWGGAGRRQSRPFESGRGECKGSGLAKCPDRSPRPHFAPAPRAGPPVLRPPDAGGAGAAIASPVFVPPPAGAGVVGTRVALHNTLLGSSMFVRKPRCIKVGALETRAGCWSQAGEPTPTGLLLGRPPCAWGARWRDAVRGCLPKFHSPTPLPPQDCARYFQSCMDPAADVFTPASELVAAVVVSPISHGAGAAAARSVLPPAAGAPPPRRHLVSWAPPPLRLGFCL
jgi:hypothetical protein